MTFPGKEEKELSFDMGGNCPPALFVATDGLEGNSQEIGYLSLGLVQFFPYLNEFPAVHGPVSSEALAPCSVIAKSTI